MRMGRIFQQIIQVISFTILYGLYFFTNRYHGIAKAIQFPLVFTFCRFNH